MGTANLSLDAWNASIKLLLALNKWEKALKDSTKGPLYWIKYRETSRSMQCNTAPLPSLWFPNVWVANAMTYLWTFEIIIYIEMKKLENFLPLGPTKALNVKDTMELATQICQSMEYLTQDKMKLYGPASTFLPLATARSAFQSAATGYEDRLEWCQKIVERLLSKGLQVIAYQMDK